MKKTKTNNQTEKLFFIKKSFLFLTFFGIFFSDFLYYFFGINFFNIGFIFWFLGYFILLIYSIYSLISIFKTSLEIKSFVSIFMIFIIFFLLLINANNSANLSGETTQEASCFLNNLKEKDYGFWRACFLGYPLRGYYLLGLPSYIFGRSLFNLHLGGFLHFLINLPIFVFTLFLLVPGKKIYDFIIGILLSFFFHLHYFNHFAFLYEQSIFPLLFSLSAFSFYYQFVNKEKPEEIILLGLILQYLIFSYTTALMTVFIIVFLLFRLFFRNKKYKKIIFLVIIFTILSVIFSFKFRMDVRIFNFKERSFDVLLKDLSDGIEHLFFQNKGTNFVSPIFHFVFIFFITVPLFGFFGRESFLLTLWIWGVIVFSIISKGYTYYDIDFRLHRSLVILPAIFFIIINAVKEFLKFKDNKKELLLVVYVFGLFYLTGYFFQFNYLSSRKPSRHYALISYIKKEIINKKKIFPSHLIFSQQVYSEYISLNDTLQYFLPGLTYSFLENDTPEKIDSKKTTVIFFSETDPISWIKEKNYKYLDNYKFDADKNLIVYFKNE